VQRIQFCRHIFDKFRALRAQAIFKSNFAKIDQKSLPDPTRRAFAFVDKSWQCA